MHGKLLLLGVSTDTRYALEYCKSMGVYTIVTDYNSPEKCPEKRQANEYWMIDLKDMDALEARCRAEGVTGVYAGNNEFCLDQTKELARRLGLPFYASDEGWASARDKLRFKAHCAAVGLDVPRRYPLRKPFDPAMLAQIEYPVIVKPTDSCAQRGLSLCRNERELIVGFDKALEHSASKEIVVEQRVEGDEVFFSYFLDDGEPRLIAVDDMIKVPLIGYRPKQVFHMRGSVYCREAVAECDARIRALFQHMDCKHGCAFFQTIRRDGKYYFLEMGYRFDGIGLWTVMPRLGQLNTAVLMLNLALARPYCVKWPDMTDVESRDYRGTIYMLWANPGRVACIQGLSEIEAVDGIDVVMKRIKEGDEIRGTDDMLQIAYYIGVVGRDNADMIEKLKYINETLRLCDENGKNLLIPFTDYDVPKIH